MASRARQARPAAGEDHPLRRLRRQRGLTQAQLAGLAPSVVPGPGERAPASPVPVAAFPVVRDEITVTRHARLAREFMTCVARGDIHATGIWLRRTARDPDVNPWLLLDQLTTPGISAPGPRPPGGAGRACYPPAVPDGDGLDDHIGEIAMCGTTHTAGQAGGNARHAAHPPGAAARIPPLTDPQGNDVTGRWPLRSFLELGALSSAVPCARLHTRHLLWEWGLTSLTDSAELLVSEIITNAVQVTQADARTASVRLWLLADRARLLMLVWDASPLPPVRMSTTSADAENGRGLLLVETLSTRWDHFPYHSDGKVVWALLEDTT